uniref:Uncharacterized protein n=1 Tax=Mus musculus TaxID=10090 RepID=Q3TNP6_MOUSE|nr:unnamed protein product [Mus musculus]
MDESFIYTSSNKVSFVTFFGSSTILILVGESLSPQCPALGMLLLLNRLQDLDFFFLILTTCFPSCRLTLQKKKKKKSFYNFF